MSAEEVGAAIAPLNAFLNLTSALLLVGGFIAIRTRSVRRHRAFMLAALITSGLFLVFYVLRFSITGTHRFAGEGWARGMYLFILFTHMILAALVVPLVLRLLYLVSRRRFHAHARLARWTYPIWMYVSVTGLLVYLLLYHVYGYL
jgi:putative membrane protein